MYDTHAHLNFPRLSNQIDKIIEDSQKVGLTGIVIASSNLEDSQKAVELAKKYSGFLFASVGIHPQKTDPGNKLSVEKQMRKLDNLVKEEYKDYKFYNNYKPVIKAVGETGLDFSEAPPGEEDRSKEDQYALFKGQIELAKKYNLPLIIHAREAVDEVVDILQIHTNISVNQPRGIFHCYAGGKKRVQKILDLPGKWYFGFDGNLTYDEGLQSVLKMIPEDRILIETDSPFLAPVPHRGEICTPAYVPLVQKKINEVLGKDLTDQVEKNTCITFGNVLK